MQWRFGLAMAACLALLAGCSNDTARADAQLVRCQAQHGAWDKLAEDWDDFFLIDCMQKNGYIVDRRLELPTGVACGQRDDPDLLPICYRRDNWLAALYATVVS